MTLSVVPEATSTFLTADSPVPSLRLVSLTTRSRCPSTTVWVVTASAMLGLRGYGCGCWSLPLPLIAGQLGSSRDHNDETRIDLDAVVITPILGLAADATPCWLRFAFRLVGHALPRKCERPAEASRPRRVSASI